MKEYMLICSTNTDELGEFVSQNLKDGWNLYGNLVHFNRVVWRGCRTAIIYPGDDKMIKLIHVLLCAVGIHNWAPYIEWNSTNIIRCRNCGGYGFRKAGK